MKQKRTGEEKLRILLTYLRLTQTEDKDVSKVKHLTDKYGVSRTDLRNWKAILFSRADEVFEHGMAVRFRTQLRKKNKELSNRVFDLEQLSGLADDIPDDED